MCLLLMSNFQIDLAYNLILLTRILLYTCMSFKFSFKIQIYVSQSEEMDKPIESILRSHQQFQQINKGIKGNKLSSFLIAFQFVSILPPLMLLCS